MIICAEEDGEVFGNAGLNGCNKPIARGDGHYECPIHGVVKLAKFLRIDSIRAKYSEGLMRLNRSDAQLTSESALAGANST